MGACIVTCPRKGCGKSFKLHKRKVTGVRRGTVVAMRLEKSRFFVSMMCKHCNAPIMNVLRIKDMRKLGYGDSVLRVVLSSGKLVGKR